MWSGPFVNHFARIESNVEETHNLRKINLCRHKADQITTIKSSIEIAIKPEGTHIETGVQFSKVRLQLESPWLPRWFNKTKRSFAKDESCLLYKSETKTRELKDAKSGIAWLLAWIFIVFGWTKSLIFIVFGWIFKSKIIIILLAEYGRGKKLCWFSCRIQDIDSNTLDLVKFNWSLK